MSESHRRKDARTNTSKTKEPEILNRSWAEDIKPSPSWWAPVSVVLMLVGLLLVVVHYISGAHYPVPGIGNWNLAVSLGVVFVGFLMLLRWK